MSFKQRDWAGLNRTSTHTPPKLNNFQNRILFLFGVKCLQRDMAHDYSETYTVPRTNGSCHQQFSLWANWAPCLDTTQLKWPLITRMVSKHPQLASQKGKWCCKHLAAPPISPWSYPTTRHSFPFLLLFSLLCQWPFVDEPPALGYPQAHGWFTLLSCLSVITNLLYLCIHSPVPVMCCLYLFLKHNSHESLLISYSVSLVTA